MGFLRPLLPIASLASVVAGSIFQAIIYDPESPLNGQTINAAGGSFSVGISEPGTYCPTGTPCPTGNTTLFAGLDALWVEVPGGQQVYVANDGLLSFTPAHSASVPVNAATGAFTNITVVMANCASTPPFNVFTWQSSEAMGTGGILVCPQTVEGSTTPEYKVYTKTPGFGLTNCTEVLGLLPHAAPSSDYGAWEYA